MAADYSYSPGIVLDVTTRQPSPSRTGALATTIGGSAVQVYDSSGSPIPNLTSTDLGYCLEFRSDIPDGYVNFGSVWQRVVSIEAQEAGLVAQAAVDAAQAAQAAAVAAQNSAAASAAQAAAVGSTSVTVIDNHLGGDATGLVPIVTAKADLVSGTVPLTQLPPGVGSVYRGTVASQAAMLAVSTARTGDWVIRTDLSARFDLTGTNPATLSHWTQVPGGGGGSSVGTIPAGSMLVVVKSGATWPPRPTARTDVIVGWKGPDPAPAIISAGTDGAINGVDLRLRTP